jgi:hypothetical protein
MHQMTTEVLVRDRQESLRSDACLIANGRAARTARARLPAGHDPVAAAEAHRFTPAGLLRRIRTAGTSGTVRPVRTTTPC